MDLEVKGARVSAFSSYVCPQLHVVSLAPRTAHLHVVRRRFSPLLAEQSDSIYKHCRDWAYACARHVKPLAHRAPSGSGIPLAGCPRLRHLQHCSAAASLFVGERRVAST
jgi:hypothetical protein